MSGSSAEVTFEEFSRVDLRVGVVRRAERIPGTKKLLKLTVDLGTAGGEREVVAGIAEWYKPEELVGKYVVVVANLKPKRIAGHASQGMILATCEGESKPVLVTLSEPAPPGSKIC